MRDPASFKPSHVAAYEHRRSSLPNGTPMQASVAPVSRTFGIKYLGESLRTSNVPFSQVGCPEIHLGGWRDREGYLYLTDRRTDMVLVGGANVYPAEVEAALEEHRAVASCAVIGLPDEDLGSRIHAIIQLDFAVNSEELLDHLRSRLAPYKLPRTFEFVPGPLRNEAGKVRRYALREERLRDDRGCQTAKP
jgi:acyl-CoA synthetase (AMP-forming)/AMP-acid ligase II